MKTFKEWLAEAKQDSVMTNPKNPVEVWRTISPDFHPPPFPPDQEFDKQVFKGVYDMEKDNLFVWWVGYAIHFDVIAKRIPSSAQHSDETIRDFDAPLIPIMYIDVKKRILDIMVRPDTDDETKDLLVKKFMVGKLKSFAKGLKITVTRGRHSHFKDYM